MDKTRHSERIFISYDTGELEWADFIRDVVKRRLPDDWKVFVAARDIRPGEDSDRRMFDQELGHAAAVIPICSWRSKKSPWIWWESAAVWGNRGKVYPLFLDISGTDFGRPMTTKQGRPFTKDGIDEILQELVVWCTDEKTTEPLDANEASKLATLKAVAARGPLDIDIKGDECLPAPGRNLARVRVSHRSDKSIQNVVVKVRSIRPATPEGFTTALPLRRSHGQRYPVILNRDCVEYFDVFMRQPAGQMMLMYEEHRAIPVPPREYTVTLAVEAEDCPTVTGTFTVYPANSGLAWPEPER